VNAEEFAAERRARFVRVDEELYPETRRALQKYVDGDPDWDKELIEDASVLWLEVFQSESPHAMPERHMPQFQASIASSLNKTEVPDDPPAEYQIDRVARWLGTYLVNDATYQAAGARGMRNKRWVTMHDSHVRETHENTDGQVRPIAAPFNVGGYELRFPGDPVGPPEIWINCRCVIQSAARRGELGMTPTTFAIEDDVEVDEDLPMDEPEDDEEEITEVPVHGVLAPEGIPTGDGRQFAVGALTHRDLPLPIAYQIMSDEGHKSAVTVGRIDEIVREGNEIRFTGALMLNRERTPEVISGIIDGTVRGISVDVDNVVLGEMSEEQIAQDFMEFSEARIAGVTIVPIPAFQEAFIGLGHEFLADLPDEAKEALAACGCDAGPEDDDDNKDIEVGYDVYDVSEDELENFRAAAEAEDGAYRDVSAVERKRLAGKGQAMPDGSYPIANCQDLRNAIQAIGRAKDPGKVKAHIRRRKSALGCPDVEIPESWAVEDVLVAAAGTHDGPGWITHPIPTARIRRYWVHGKGAAKIRWGAPGDFNRCRRQLAKYVKNPEWLDGTCANMHHEALGFWPSTHRKLVRGHALVSSGQPAPIFSLVAAATRTYPAEWFTEPDVDPSKGIVVGGEWVYGYVAQWNMCHIGIDGLCTTAPPSSPGYPYYATGVVHTDDGGVTHVGQITMDTGHAALKANHRVAAAHYDNTGSAVADVAVGENAYGIWFAGVLRRNATEDQVHALEASGRLSGDWRKILGQWEMVAALCVNVPGFPIPQYGLAASGEQMSLVAAGVIEPERALSAAAVGMEADVVAGIVRAAIDEYRHAEKREARIAPIRETLRQKRVETLRTKIK
jgi:hypothetical protein